MWSFAHRVVARLSRAGARALLVALALPAAAAAADLEQPGRRQTEPPRFFERSARAGRADRRRARTRCARRAATAALDPTAYTQGRRALAGELLPRRRRARAGAGRRPQRRGARAVVAAHQVAWTMARGYPGAFGRKLNAPVRLDPAVRALPGAVRRLPAAASGCCTSTCSCCSVRRLARLLQPRRDRRLGAARLPGAAVPARADAAGRASGRARAAGPLVPHAPLTLLVVGLVFLVAFRIGLNVADSNVIDVGYAGVIGADRIVDGDRLYGDGLLRATSSAATPTGPVNYLALRAVRAGAAVERALGRPARRPRRRDRVRPAGARRPAAARPAAAAGPRGHGARASRSPTPGPPTPTRRSRSSRTRTTRSWRSRASGRCWRRRSRATGVGRGCALARSGLGAAAKFVTLALAPLFARRSPRASFVGALVAGVLALVVLPVPPRRRPARALRPHDRLPGERGPRRSASGARSSRSAGSRRREGGRGRRSRSWSPSCRAGPSLRQIAALGAAILIAVAADGDALVLPLRRLVRALRVRGAVRRARRGPPAPRPRPEPRARARGRCSHEARPRSLALAVLAAGWALTLWVRARGRTSASTTCSSTARFAEPVLDGGLPYRDVAFEYPPLAAPAIALPGLAGTGEEAFRLGVRALDARCWRRPWCCSAARSRARRAGTARRAHAGRGAHAAPAAARCCARTSTSFPVALAAGARCSCCAATVRGRGWRCSGWGR